LKKILTIVLALAMVASIAGAAMAQQDQTGNGAPSGYHYTLNIIGVQNPKTATMDGSNGHVIFVSLSGHNKIELTEGDDFAVLDANAFDDPAEFMLPPPGVDPYIIGNTTGKDTITDYSVFVRPLGKPGGWANITTCADLVDSTFGGLLPSNVQKTILNSAGYFGGYASIEQVGSSITFRDSKKSTFTNVTAQLTTIVFRVWVDLNVNTVQDEGEIYYVRVPIFDDALQGEYWDYDNAGLKNLQIRFYPGVPSDLTEWDSPYQ
jgi:hypothetical protein